MPPVQEEKMKQLEQNYQLTGRDIKEIRERMDPSLVIVPYEDANVKGCGYNLTATEFIYSVKKKRLLAIHKSNREATYVDIPRHDTALILTREYIKLSGRLAGAFYSRVQMVSQGLGHISTTLDPCWDGMLLFAVNNPSSRKIRLVISESSDGTTTYTGIATMVLNPTRPDGDGPEKVSPSLDNPPMRLDVLKRLIYQPNHIFFDSRYQRFRRLISELETFTPKLTPKMEQLRGIRGILVELEKELVSYNCQEEISGWLVELERANYDKLESLQRKIMCLNAKMDDILPEVRGCLLECDYLLTCEQVEQIHALIQKWVPHVYHPTVKHFFGFLLEHWKIWAVYALAIIGASVVFWRGKETIGTNVAVLIPAIATLLPPFITFLLDRSSPPK